MKISVTFLALALPLAAQEAFDFKTLDGLAVNAKNKTAVTLNADMLKLAAGFLREEREEEDAHSLKSLVKNLRAVYVREYEYEKTGQYNEADLAPLRAFLKAPRWNKVVEAKEGGETSEIYMQALPGGQLAGVAIISIEPREVTVVFIDGVLNSSDVAALGGTMGIPDLDALQKLGKKSEKKRRED